MVTAKSDSNPLVAVLLPTFKHPSLLIDALESALRQRISFPYRILVIDDECPYEDTINVCREYATRYPDKVAYVRKRNGGLSSSRNVGIHLALRTWPSIKALYILDSDDRMGPHLLERSFHILQANPSCSWVSPDIREFGKTRYCTDMNVPMTRLQLLVSNCYSAAAMIRREVFESGVAFDEQMKLGYEDWDVWIQGASRGLRGQALADGDFQYRRRAESMVVESGRNDQYIRRYIRDKHAGQYTIRKAAEDEDAELPRFAVYLCKSKRLCLTSDIRRMDRWLAVGEFAPHVRRWVADPARHPFPPLALIIDDNLLESDLILRLLPGLIWSLQERLAGHAFATASFEMLPGIETSVAFEEPTQSPLPRTICRNDHVVLTRTRVLHECLAAASGQWLGSVLTDHPEPQISRLHVDCITPKARLVSATSIWPEILDLVEQGRDGYVVPTPLRPQGWKNIWRPPTDGQEMFQSLFGFRNYLPCLPDRGRIHVGYTLPVCSLGGVERMVCNYGRESRRRGWVPHLFLVGCGQMRMLHEFADTFETITIIPAENLQENQRLLGLLALMDVVVNSLSNATTAITSQLRQNRVKVLSHLQNFDINREGMSCGHPYSAVQHEHTLDGLIVPSQKLQCWLEASGVPASKILMVPNGVSYAISEANAESAQFERENRGDHKLRVLFLGGLDRQKGLDRLVELVRQTQLRLLPFTWRIAGQRVLEDKSLDLSSISTLVEPPAVTPFALGQLFRWADVLVCVSRSEGVPPTILEGQRFGCAVLSTDVGAISEAIESGKTGVLFPNHENTEQLVDQMLACMEQLQQDPGLRREIGRAAAAQRRAENWEWCFQALAARIESIMAPAVPNRKAVNT